MKIVLGLLVWGTFWIMSRSLLGLLRLVKPTRQRVTRPKLLK
jgi:hypothetical protein